MKESDFPYRQTVVSKPVITEEEKMRLLSLAGSQIEAPSPTLSETSGADELHNHIEEILDLQQTFLEMLADAAHDGVDHGYRGKWRTQSFDKHLDHAIMHLLALKYPREGDEEKHLAHAAFRIASAGVMEFIEIEENSNDVDRWESEGGAAVGRPEIVGDSIQINGEDVRREDMFEFGQVVNHPSGLGTKKPDRRFEWHCARCDRNHPYIENCPA